MSTKRTTLLRITKRKDGSTQISGSGEMAALLFKAVTAGAKREQAKKAAPGKAVELPKPSREGRDG